MVDIAPGAVIGSRYRLDRLLGEGGMGSVWAATHVVTRKHVALKFLKAAAADRPDVVHRFLREARAASAVNHPNVVQIHDIMQLEGGLPVMVMDLLVGESLGEKVAREGRVAVPELARVLVPVISAVGTAHALGIVHRDLKPDNIFLARLPDGRLDPKVLDFGIAKLTADEGDAAKTAGLTQTGSMLGTPYYMAPEQAFGEKDLDQRADVWAMGVILYQCLAGRRPVTGENLGQLFKVLMSGDITPLHTAAPDLPADVCNLVDRMMVPDRAHRMPDLREALEVLRRYTDEAGQSFGAPAAAIVADQPQDTHEAPVAQAPVSETLLAPANTGAPLAAVAAPAPPAPPRRTGALVAGGAAVLIAAAAGIALLARTPAPAPADAAASAAAEAAPPPTALAVTPAPPAPPAEPAPAAPTASAAAPSPTASAATQVASTAAAPARPHPGRPQPAPTSAPSAAPSASSKAPLPGGVVGDVPF